MNHPARSSKTPNRVRPVFSRPPTATPVHERIGFAIGACRLGHVLVAATDTGVCAIALGDDADTLYAELGHGLRHARRYEADAACGRYVEQVALFMDLPQLGLALPLDAGGTPFQQRVWQALQAIPLGETRSYAQIARAIGAREASRAVAGACARNPVALAVPCHRVVRADGALSGYRWGIERKRAMLAREREARIDRGTGTRID